MSHFFKQGMPGMSSPDCLVAGLLRSGFTMEQIEVHESPVPIQNYQGKSLGQRAHVVVRRKHIGHYANDLGFELVDGEFVMHRCDWAVTHYGKGEAWQHRVQQGYQLEKALRQAGQRRQPVKIEERADGAVYVRVSGYA